MDDLHLIPNLLAKEEFLLMKGGFGEIYYVINDDGVKYCKKKIKKSDYEKKFYKEDVYLKMFHHINIVEYLYSGYDKDYYVIIMKYYVNGSLADIIKAHRISKSKFYEREIIHFYFNICMGINEIHKMGVIHRDIKPHNIFVDEDYTPKIGDFGLSVDNKTIINKVEGTPLYLSPEIIKSQEYSNKSDLWSLGVVLYELCTLERPFNNEDEILNKEITGVVGYSEVINNIIKTLLSKNPNDRDYSFSNTDVENRAAIFEDGVNNMIKNDFDDAIQKFENSYSIFAYDSVKADYYKNIAYCYFRKNEYDKAEEYYQQSKLFIKRNDSDRKYEINVNCGNIYYSRNDKNQCGCNDEIIKMIENLMKGIDYYTEASNYAKENNMIFIDAMIRKSKQKIDNIINNNVKVHLQQYLDNKEKENYCRLNYIIGKYKYYNEDYNNAIEYLNDAYDIYKNTNDRSNEAYDCLLLIGICYIEKKEYEKGLDVLKECNDFNLSEEQRFQQLNYLIRVNTVLGKYELAKYYCEETERIAKNRSQKCELYIRYANLYNCLKNRETSKKYCEKALRYELSRKNKCRINIIKANNERNSRERIKYFKQACIYASGSLIHTLKFQLAQAYYDNKKYKESIECCGEIYEIVADKFDIEILLMYNYASLNNYDECKSHYEKVKVINKREDDLKIERDWIKCLTKMKKFEEVKDKINELTEKYKANQSKLAELNKLNDLLPKGIIQFILGIFKI